eukprot:TRINITY_DN1198_c0_g1_i1.p1 TRINITY_DN1198_c0_g1~~TRINITY_DN1198_c0_g1_i1.p1  ORF type:complete len:227 (-),score=37.84 TRINITY_DN1198_c0_g1_i1:55-735(-)
MFTANHNPKSLNLSNPHEITMFGIKVVLIGDPKCGKTAMCSRHSQNRFIEEYIPTVFDNYTINTLYNDASYSISLWDTAGHEDYDRLRPLSYAETNIVLLCFSLNDRVSFDNIILKWYPEVETYCPGAPVILVGCKSDLPGVVSAAEIDQLKAEIGVVEYICCSALSGYGIEKVVEKVCDYYVPDSSLYGGEYDDESEEEVKTGSMIGLGLMNPFLLLSFVGEESW